jgi:hypothetical protein
VRAKAVRKGASAACEIASEIRPLCPSKSRRYLATKTGAVRKPITSKSISSWASPTNANELAAMSPNAVSRLPATRLKNVAAIANSALE